MSHAICNLSCGTILFNKMMSFVTTGSYVTAGHFTIRHKILINCTSKPNKTSELQPKDN